MSKKFNILLVLAALLCLALSASAVTSPYVVVKQNAQTIKTRGEIKDHFKRRSITTFRGNSVTNQNNIASTAFSPNKAPAATAVKIPDLIGSKQCRTQCWHIFYKRKWTESHQNR